MVPNDQLLKYPRKTVTWGTWSQITVSNSHENVNRSDRLNSRVFKTGRIYIEDFSFFRNEVVMSLLSRKPVLNMLITHHQNLLF